MSFWSDGVWTDFSSQLEAQRRVLSSPKNSTCHNKSYNFVAIKRVPHMPIFRFFQAAPPHWEIKKKRKKTNTCTWFLVWSLQSKYLKIFKPYFTTITVLVFFILIYTLIFIISCLKYIQLMYRLCYKRLTVKCVFREMVYNHGLTVKSSVCVKIIRTLLHTAVLLILSQYHIFSR